MEAVQGQTVDVIKRMKEITLVMKTPEQVLESQGVTAQDIEGVCVCVCIDDDFRVLCVVELDWILSYFSFFVVDMLDELQEHVESIDMANG